MAVVKKYKPGEFCWADLATTDAAKAKKFYRALFGWEVKETPMGDNHAGASYSMLRVKGKDVCALFPMPGDLKKMKMQPSWLPYIAVANVDRTAVKAVKAGGVICLGPLDATKAGRFAVMQDPTGARFALWQAKAHIGTKVGGVPGTICWRDLSTPDRKAAGKFYTKVFGWKQEDKDFSGNLYHLFKIGKNGLGGMWPFPLPKWPPAWFTYWIVKDCAKSAAKAKRLKGRVILGPITVPDTTTFAIIKDPQGAAFGILEPF